MHELMNIRPLPATGSGYADDDAEMDAIRLKQANLIGPAFKLWGLFGDFVATLTTYKEDIDIALLSTKSRKLWKNRAAGLLVG